MHRFLNLHRPFFSNIVNSDMFHIFTILRNPSFCSSVLNICTVRGISKHLNWSSLQHPGIIEFVFYLNAQPRDLDPYPFDSWVQRANFWAATYYFYIDGTLFILCHVLRHWRKDSRIVWWQATASIALSHPPLKYIPFVSDLKIVWKKS